MNDQQIPHTITQQEFMGRFAEACSKSYRQLEFKLYETTPMFSVWTMRDKWKKYGDYWAYVMLPEARKDRSTTEPAVQCPPIQLAYARVGTDKVIQIAYWSELELNHDN